MVEAASERLLGDHWFCMRSQNHSLLASLTSANRGRQSHSWLSWNRPVSDPSHWSTASTGCLEHALRTLSFSETWPSSHVYSCTPADFGSRNRFWLANWSIWILIFIAMMLAAWEYCWCWRGCWLGSFLGSVIDLNQSHLKPITQALRKLRWCVLPGSAEGWTSGQSVLQI